MQYLSVFAQYHNFVVVVAAAAAAAAAVVVLLLLLLLMDAPRLVIFYRVTAI